MATISRPGKEGGATTYQGKVALGYTKILAQEVDADFDAIYAAWNAGVDTVNIKDAAVTAPKLAPGAVTGTALAPGSITHAALAANSVDSSNIVDGSIVGADIAAGTLTDSLIANVAWTKLIAPFTGMIPLTPRGAVFAGSTYLELEANGASGNNYDASKPSYLLRIDYSGDNFELWRSPPPGTSWMRMLYVTGGGILNAYYPDQFVTRQLLGVNAVNSAPVFTPAPTGFVLNVTGWTTFATLAALTTRGGFVHLWAAAGLSVNAPPAGGNAYSRWLCDGAPVVQDVHQIGGNAVYASLPNLNWLHNPPAGAHTYVYQVAVDTGMTMISSSAGGGGFLAVEVG